MTDYISIYITCATWAEAQKIAEALVIDGLAACANIGGEIQSVYVWDGEQESNTETPLIIKTRADLFAAVEARVKTLHSAAVPCIVAWQIVAGNQDYLSWLKTNTKDPRQFDN